MQVVLFDEDFRSSIVYFQYYGFIQKLLSIYIYFSSG